MASGSGNASNQLIQAVQELDLALARAKVKDARVRRALVRVQDLARKLASNSST